MRTEYTLSYEIHHGPPGFMSQGRDVYVRLEFSQKPAEAVLNDAHALIIAFDVLALSSAFTKNQDSVEARSMLSP